MKKLTIVPLVAAFLSGPPGVAGENPTEEANPRHQENVDMFLTIQDSGRTIQLMAGRTVRFEGHGELAVDKRKARLSLPAGARVQVDGRTVQSERAVGLEDDVKIVARGSSWRLAVGHPPAVGGPALRIEDNEAGGQFRVHSKAPTVFFVEALQGGGIRVYQGRG